MIPVRIGCGGITTKTFTLAVIVMVDPLPFPFVLTLDAEMIVGPFDQVAGACLGLVKALGKDDSCRYARTLFFGHRQYLIRIDINDPVDAGLGGQAPGGGQQQDSQK